MAADPVQLFYSSGDPRGRRYTPEEKESAYLTWRLAGRRSLAKTAEIAGIAENTIRSWAKEEGWQQRAEQDDEDASQLARQALASMTTNEVVKSLETVVALRDDPNTPARTRLDAAEYLLGVWGVSPTRVAEVTVRPSEPRGSRSIDPASLRNLSDAELAALERSLTSGKGADRELARLSHGSDSESEPTPFSSSA